MHTAGSPPLTSPVAVFPGEVDMHWETENRVVWNEQKCAAEGQELVFFGILFVLISKNIARHQVPESKRSRRMLIVRFVWSDRKMKPRLGEIIFNVIVWIAVIMSLGRGL